MGKWVSKRKRNHHSLRLSGRTGTAQASPWVSLEPSLMAPGRARGAAESTWGVLETAQRTPGPYLAQGGS